MVEKPPLDLTEYSRPEDGDSDWAVFKALKRYRQAQGATRRETFMGGIGWTKHTDAHWSYQLLGNRLDYWPGTDRFRWRNKTYNGGVLGFISKREKEALQS